MVNNAGIAIEAYVPKPIHEADDEVYDKTMRVNSRSVFLGTKYAGKQMIKQDPHPSGDRGWIINTASMLSMVGYRGAVSYTASKGSALQITKTAALDYAPYRIHVNALCPGCQLLFRHSTVHAMLIGYSCEDVHNQAYTRQCRDLSCAGGYPPVPGSR